MIHIDSSLNRNQINEIIVQCFQHINQVGKKRLVSNVYAAHLFVRFKALFYAMMESEWCCTHCTSKIPSMKMWLAEVTAAHFGIVTTTCTCVQIAHCTSIDSSTDATDVSAANPIYCAICHVERSNSSNDNKSISIWKSHIRRTQKMGTAKPVPEMHWI